MSDTAVQPQDSPPLQTLRDTVEAWISETGEFYGELQERLEAAQEHLQALQSSGANATASGLSPEAHAELRELRSENAHLQAQLQQREQDISRLQEALTAAEEAQARIEELEAALEQERRVSRNLQQALEGAHQELNIGEPESDTGPGGFEVPDIRAFDPQGHKKRIGAILVEQGIITAEQLNALLLVQSSAPHVRLGALAIEKGYTNESLVAKVLAAQLRLPYVDLQHIQVEPKVLELLSSHLARLHRCLPLRQEQGRLVLAMANPVDLIAIEDIELATRLRVDPVVGSPAAIERAVDRLYPAL